MVSLNYGSMQMTAKIVYYGPGLGGKTTNLQYIYAHTAAASRGEMVMLETEADRTLFFDLLPLEVGSVAGFKTRIQLYTVPGQVFYNTTRKLVLKGVDGVVFVADAQRPMLEANVESLRNLDDNLASLGQRLANLPVVLQYNKRDLPDTLTSEELNGALNPEGWAWFEASALLGRGVFETLKEVSKLTLLALRKRVNLEEAEVSPRSAEVRRPAVPVAAAAARHSGPAATRDNGRPAARARRGPDVLERLEEIRREALAPPAPGRNGGTRIQRDIALTLRRRDLEQARRFSLSLRVEGGERSTEVIRDLPLDLDADPVLDPVVLRLNIAVNAKE